MLNEKWLKILREYSEARKLGIDQNRISNIDDPNDNNIPYISWLEKHGRIFYINGAHNSMVVIDPNRDVHRWCVAIREYCDDHDIDWLSEDHIFNSILEAMFNERMRISLRREI